MRITFHVSQQFLNRFFATLFNVMFQSAHSHDATIPVSFSGIKSTPLYYRSRAMAYLIYKSSNSKKLDKKKT